MHADSALPIQAAATAPDEQAKSVCCQIVADFVPQLRVCLAAQKRVPSFKLGPDLLQGTTLCLSRRLVLTEKLVRLSLSCPGAIVSSF